MMPYPPRPCQRPLTRSPLFRQYVFAMADNIPFGFEVVPRDATFVVRGTAFDVHEPGYQEQWDSWGSDVMLTRIFLIGVPVDPDRTGRVHLAFMPVALPRAPGEPSEALLSHPLTVTLNLN